MLYNENTKLKSREGWGKDTSIYRRQVSKRAPD